EVEARIVKGQGDLLLAELVERLAGGNGLRRDRQLARLAPLHGQRPPRLGRRPELSGILPLRLRRDHDRRDDDAQDGQRGDEPDQPAGKQTTELDRGDRRHGMAPGGGAGGAGGGGGSVSSRNTVSRSATSGRSSVR